MNQNKWAFVCYTGQRTQVNCTRWFVVKPCVWSLLRHQLEAFGPELVEREALGGPANGYNGRPLGTFLRAYKAWAPVRHIKATEGLPTDLSSCLHRRKLILEHEIGGHDYVAVNTFVAVVRHSLPLGARPFVPIEERSKWALLQRDLEMDPDNERARAAMQALVAEHQDRFHAADRPIERVTLNPARAVETEHTWSVPLSDYICSRCKRVGHHFVEACEIFTPDVPLLEEPAIMWGPKKFGGLKATTANDAAYYAVMHKKMVSRK